MLLKSFTNLVFISRLNPVVDGSEIGCCSDEVHVVVGVVVLVGDGGKMDGYCMYLRMLCTWACIAGVHVQGMDFITEAKTSLTCTLIDT